MTTTPTSPLPSFGLTGTPLIWNGTAWVAGSNSITLSNEGINNGFIKTDTQFNSTSGFYESKMQFYNGGGFNTLEITAEGIKFPDNTMQTTAGGGLSLDYTYNDGADQYFKVRTQNHVIYSSYSTYPTDPWDLTAGTGGEIIAIGAEGGAATSASITVRNADSSLYTKLNSLYLIAEDTSLSNVIYASFGIYSSSQISLPPFAILGNYNAAVGAGVGSVSTHEYGYASVNATNTTTLDTSGVALTFVDGLLAPQCGIQFINNDGNANLGLIYDNIVSDFTPTNDEPVNPSNINIRVIINGVVYYLQATTEV
jgi:hypothetical protein